MADSATICVSYMVTACENGGYYVQRYGHDRQHINPILFAATTRREVLGYIDVQLALYAEKR